MVVSTALSPVLTFMMTGLVNPGHRTNHTSPNAPYPTRSTMIFYRFSINLYLVLALGMRCYNS